MINIRRSNERGHANHGWLDTHFSFSFADYYDPQFMGFRNLRVINEDFIEPAQGFPKHGHRDMEIITYMISGELSHRDSMGNGETIRPNEVQRMTAGTGRSAQRVQLADRSDAPIADLDPSGEEKSSAGLRAERNSARRRSREIEAHCFARRR
jgi:hypothetical protein